MASARTARGEMLLIPAAASMSAWLGRHLSIFCSVRSQCHRPKAGGSSHGCLGSSHGCLGSSHGCLGSSHGCLGSSHAFIFWPQPARPTRLVARGSGNPGARLPANATMPLTAVQTPTATHSSAPLALPKHTPCALFQSSVQLVWPYGVPN
jgi:hypothetical protein